MKQVQAVEIQRTYTNGGQHAQQKVDATLTGQIRKADHVPFDLDSDIPELKCSVKSARFTLASNLQGETVAEQLTDYLQRTASECVAYYAKTLDAVFVMSLDEFAQFVSHFCKIQHSSAKNGSKAVTRMGTETKAVREWLLTA